MILDMDAFGFLLAQPVLYGLRSNEQSLATLSRGLIRLYSDWLLPYLLREAAKSSNPSEYRVEILSAIHDSEVTLDPVKQSQLGLLVDDQDAEVAEAALELLAGLPRRSFEASYGAEHHT